MMDTLTAVFIVIIAVLAIGLMAVVGAAGWLVIFGAEQIKDLRQQNTELIDKFMFNKQPERIVKQNATPLTPVQTFGAGGMGDPVSIAEEKARRASIPADQVLDEG